MTPTEVRSRFNIAATFASRAVLMPVVFWLSACGTPAPDGTRHPDNEGFQVVSSLKFDYLEEAASNLSSFSYQQTTKTVWTEAGGAISASEHRVVQHTGGRAEVLEQIAEGDFNRGLIGRLLAPKPDLMSGAAAFTALLPNEPAYLSPRNREAFEFRLRDSSGRPAVEVVLRDEDAVEIDLRRALLTYEPSTHQVLAIEIDRRSRSTFQSYESRGTLVLEHVAGAWLPASFEYRDRRNSPLQRPFDLRKQVRYSEYRRL